MPSDTERWPTEAAAAAALMKMAEEDGREVEVLLRIARSVLDDPNADRHALVLADAIVDLFEEWRG